MKKSKLTVYDLLQLKGKRQIHEVYVNNVEEAIAAEEAGMDMICTAYDMPHHGIYGKLEDVKRIREAAPNTHLMSAAPEKSYATEDGKVVKVKLETSAGNVSGLTHEMDMNTTVANQWETLTYDFTEAPDLEYISFIVFYDFGNTQGATYRFDEIQLID